MDEPTKIKDKHGNIKHYLSGKLHRTNGPAIERPDGTKEWWLNNKLHRDDGPAVEHANGDKFWYLYDKCHRTDGPAVERPDGSKEWWITDHYISMKNYRSFVNDYPDLVNQFLAHQVLNG